MKPIYKIHKATIVGNRLYGYPDSSDTRFFDDELIRTSAIVSVNGNTVETKNSVYEVESWNA